MLITVHEKLHASSERREFFFEHPQLIPLVGFYPVYDKRTEALALQKTVVSAKHLGRKLQTLNTQHLKRLLKQTVDHMHAQHMHNGYR